MERKTIVVYTENKYLFQKIRHDAPQAAEVVLGSKEGTAADNGALILWDTLLGECRLEGALTLGKTGADVTLPFPLGTVDSLLSERPEKELFVDAKNRTAILHGAAVKLTEVEFSLFYRLYERGGEYVSREELLSSVWGNGCDGGILNVYIHYLREKLERGGEKIILSSRKFGYSIDKRFLGGRADA